MPVRFPARLTDPVTPLSGVQNAARQNLDSSRHLARLLDSVIRVPGTKLRIGLDPILGLIPGVGDAIAAGLGSMIVLQAMKSGVPRALLLRMAGNLMINSAIGAIPVAGDLFSAWFHSNSRNYALLKAWQEGVTNLPAAPQTKWVAAGCAVSLVLVAGLGLLTFWAVSIVWKWMMAA